MPPTRPIHTGSLEERVVTCLQHLGPMSRSDLARTLGLAKSTITAVVSALLDSSSVSQVHTCHTGGRGRPSVLVSLRPEAGAAIGLDFGYRHVRGVVADLSHSILAREERVLESNYNLKSGITAAEHIVRNLIDRSAMPRSRFLGIGVAIPCPTDRNGVATRSSIIPKWKGVNIADQIETLVDLPVTVDNDSRLATYGEKVWGAGRDCENFAYLKLHSGIGGGIVINGRLVEGHNGGAGEFGHISLDPAGPLCRCGNRGCLEAYAGIPAIMEQLRPVTGEVDLAELVRRLKQGDAAVGRILTEVGERVGQAAGMLCNAFNPERIIIGGSLSQAGTLLLDLIRSRMTDVSLELNRSPLLCIGALGRDASAQGAVARVFSVTRYRI